MSATYITTLPCSRVKHTKTIRVPKDRFAKGLTPAEKLEHIRRNQPKGLPCRTLSKEEILDLV